MVPRKAGEASPKGGYLRWHLKKRQEGKADNRKCTKAQQGGRRESWRVWTRVLKPEAGSKDGGVSHLTEGLTCQVEKLWFILETTGSLWRPGRRGGACTEDKSKGPVSQCMRECLTHSPSPHSRSVMSRGPGVRSLSGLFHQISLPEATLKKPRRPPALGVFASCFEVGVGGEKEVFQKVP